MFPGPEANICVDCVKYANDLLVNREKKKAAEKSAEKGKKTEAEAEQDTDADSGSKPDDSKVNPFDYSPENNEGNPFDYNNKDD